MDERIAQYVARARALPDAERQRAIQSLKETVLHVHLRELFSRMEPTSTIEVTHGANERGKDLVIVRKSPISVDVVAVVVKTGDIRAKTAGDVDDVLLRVRNALNSKSRLALEQIESQVQQALRHPARVRAYFDSLAVHKVIVVIAGQISNDVYERLSREKPGSVEIKDLGWLVDSFTEHYPEVFFEATTLTFLSAKIESLERQHAYEGKSPNRTFNLSEYFTSPYLAPLNVYSKDDSISFSDQLKNLIEQKRYSFATLPKEMSRNRRIMLLGDPGVGKSGLLAKLAVDSFRYATDQLLDGRSTDRIRVPLLVHATRLQALETLDELLDEFQNGAADRLNRYNFDHLFVDGLDEVRYDSRAEVAKRAVGFAEALNCPLVMTSRKVELLDNIYEEFSKLEVLPFEIGQAVKLLEKLLPYESAALTTLLQDLEELEAQYPLSPLTLRMLVSLAEESKEVPASLTELYEQYFDTVLGRYDGEKGIEVLFTYQVKSQFLAALAYKAYFLEGRTELPRGDFDTFVDTFGEEHQSSWGAEQRDRLVRELIRSGVLVVSKHRVMFRHKTYLDYFAARFLSSFRDEIIDLQARLTRAHFSSLWADVAFFYVGQLRRLPPALMSELFAYEKLEDPLFVALRKTQVGRLLQSGWSTPSQQKRTAIAKASVHLTALRDSFLKELNDAGQSLPLLFGDFLVYWLAQMSFSSGTLLSELRVVLDDLTHDIANTDLFVMVGLLFAGRRFFTETEREHYVSVVLDELVGRKAANQLDRNDEIRMLVALTSVEVGNPELERSIRRKLARTARSAPNVVKALIPSRTSR